MLTPNEFVFGAFLMNHWIARSDVLSNIRSDEVLC